MSLTHDQRAAVNAPGSAAVIAGAGTGKTHMLAERYLFHIREQGLKPLQIVAVTFTEKAAAELRARIRNKLTVACESQNDLIVELEAAQISTIHALAARICREHPEQAGVPVDFQILDDVEGQVLSAEILLEIVENLPEEPFSTIPFSMVMSIIHAAMQNPIMARRALEVDPNKWRERIESYCREEFETLQNHPFWIEARDTLQCLQGTENDLMEIARRNALQAIQDFLTPPHPLEALQAIELFTKRGGSAKNWPAGQLDRCKETLAQLKKWLNDYKKDSIFHLQPTEIDETLVKLHPVMKSVCEQVLQDVSLQKRARRILDFNDLEIHALQALRNKSVRLYYRERWQAFLIDEFQDTNPVQAEMIQALTEKARVTIVGDMKQSIYGFRGADAEVFRRYTQRIESNGGQVVTLSQSFRTHTMLIDQLNSICASMLGDEHQELLSERAASTDGPFVQCFYVNAEDRSIAERRRIEAKKIGGMIQNLLNSDMQIHDKSMQCERPIRPKDIAILSRTWEPLDLYSDTLGAMSIPAIHAGGGNLLETREAKDAIALLRFIADPRDDLALAAVLRSPFFALSDRILYAFAQEIRQEEKKRSWWKALHQTREQDLLHPLDVLQKLIWESRLQPPSRLLQIADQGTGYTAVIGNLPGADRRLADWKGFLHWVRGMEHLSQDVFLFIRRLSRIIEAEVEIPRPLLQAENAVSLMTIHAAKGLEWPVVFVPDLSRRMNADHSSVLYDPEFGFALKCNTEEKEATPILFTFLSKRKKKREQEEQKRLLYVALTRARDALVLTASGLDDGGIKILLPGLHSAQVEVNEISFTEEDVLPLVPPPPPIQPVACQTLFRRFGRCLTELPVTSIPVYSQCPKRFELNFVYNHPGLAEGGNQAMRVGTLTHLALEYDVFDVDSLARFDATLPRQEVDRAFSMAQVFWNTPDFQKFAQETTAREVSFSHQVRSIRFNGQIDLLGPDWVLDFKTDQAMVPEHHRLQLALYAHESKSKSAHIAYLHHGRLHTFTQDEVAEAMSEIEKIVTRIEKDDFEAIPSQNSCAYCPYAHREICTHRIQDV